MFGLFWYEQLHSSNKNVDEKGIAACAGSSEHMQCEQDTPFRWMLQIRVKR